MSCSTLTSELLEQVLPTPCHTRATGEAKRQLIRNGGTLIDPQSMPTASRFLSSRRPSGKQQARPPTKNILDPRHPPQGLGVWGFWGTHAHARTHAHTYPHTPTHPHTHTPTHPHTHTPTHPHTHTPTHTYTHTPTRTRTHTHTHTQRHT